VPLKVKEQALILIISMMRLTMVVKNR